MYSIVFITFHIGNFLSVSGFGHAICDSFRNEHVVILLDMMLRARIAIMNMRAMDGGDCDRKYHNEPKNTCMKNGFEGGQSGNAIHHNTLFRARNDRYLHGGLPSWHSDLPSGSYFWAEM